MSREVLDWFRDHPELMDYSVDGIVRNARKYTRYGGDHTPTTEEGVYFLVNAGEIVYVGKAESINSRLASHWLTKKFDSYWCFGGVPYEWLEYIENLYIRRLHPRLNDGHAFNCPHDLEEVTDRLEMLCKA